MKKTNVLVVTILLSLLASNSISETKQTYGSWEVDSFVANGYPFTYANTTNNSDSTLGVICIENSSNCVPYLVNQLTCEKDGRYPALVSVDSGITAIAMSCLIISDMYLFLLPDSHLNLILSNNNYSVAFGASTGKFKAAYFSLNGSAKAVLAAKTLINAIADAIDENENNSQFEDTVL